MQAFYALLPLCRDYIASYTYPKNPKFCVPCAVELGVLFYYSAYNGIVMRVSFSFTEFIMVILPAYRADNPRFQSFSRIHGALLGDILLNQLLFNSERLNIRYNVCAEGAVLI